MPDGLWRARVENNRDPMNLGRIQVRVYSDSEGLKGDSKVWASPCFPLFSGYDSGSFVVPLEGSTVIVGYEGGDTQKPVYLGGVFGKGSRHPKPFNNISTDQSHIASESGGDIATVAGVSEIPQDAFVDMSGFEPHRQVIYKSIKGSTIVIEDADEYENLQIIDRSGQVIGLFSPVLYGENNGNRGRRGLQSVIETTPKNPDTTSYLKRAVILLKGLAGSLVRIVSEFRKERAEIVSTNNRYYDQNNPRASGVIFRSGENDISFTLFSENPKKTIGIKITGDVDNQTLELSMNNQSRIVLSENGVSISTKGTLSIHANDSINISTPGSFSVNASSVSLDTGSITMPEPAISSGSGPSPSPDPLPLTTLWSDSRDELFDRGEISREPED